MEEIIVAVAKEVPTTAVLILFVYLVNAQFERAIDLITKHLSGVVSLIEICINSHNKDDSNVELELKLTKLLNELSDIRERQERDSRRLARLEPVEKE